MNLRLPIQVSVNFHLHSSVDGCYEIAASGQPSWVKVIPVSLQFLASKSIAPVKRCVYRKNFKLRKIIELAEEIHIEQSVWHPA